MATEAARLENKEPTGRKKKNQLDLTLTGLLMEGAKPYAVKIICESEVTIVTVQETLAVAEQRLPGRPAPDGTEDARWQAIIQVAMFAEREPEVIWPFVLKWGSHEEEDVRAAIATCLLEDLLQYHFDLLFPLVASAAKSNEFFAKTTAMCWKFGEAAEPTRAAQFDALCAEIRKSRT